MTLRSGQVDTNRRREEEGEDLWHRCCLTLNKFRFTIVALMYPTSITVLYEEEKCYELMEELWFHNLSLYHMY